MSAARDSIRPTDDRRLAALGALGLLVAALAVFWPALTYPHISDDWGWLYRAWTQGSGEYLTQSFDPRGVLFFRPLAACHHWLMYQLFGLEALGFHVVALVAHWVNALLVFRLCRDLCGRQDLAWLAGLLYATSSNIFLDPMMWMVGFSDLAGSGLGLAALLLHRGSRPVASAVALLLGMLFRESTVIFAGAIFLHELLDLQGLGRLLRPRLARLAGPGAVVLALFAIKAAGTSMFGLPDDHPYKMALWGGHLASNLGRYGQWTIDTLFPWNLARLPAPGWTVVVLALGLLGGLGYLVWRARSSPAPVMAPPSISPRLPWFLLGWFAMALAPLLPMRSHCYLYYLSSAMLPLLLGAILLIDLGLRKLRLPARQAALVLGAYATISVCCSATYLLQHHLAGLEDRYRFGTNHLIHRGATAELVRSSLAEHEIPRGAVLGFTNVSIVSFLGQRGLRLMLDDDTVRLVDRGGTSHREPLLRFELVDRKLERLPDRPGDP